MLAIKRPNHKRCKTIRVVAIDDDTGKSRSATVYGGTKDQVIDAFVDAIQAAAASEPEKKVTSKRIEATTAS